MSMYVGLNKEEISDLLAAATFTIVNPKPSAEELKEAYFSYIYPYVFQIQQFDRNQLYQKRFYFKASNGKIVSGEDGLCSMKANRNAARAHEFFIMERIGDFKVAFKSMGKYMSSENGYEKMHCDRRKPDEWERYEIIHHHGNAFSLKGNNGMYVSNRDGHLYCDAAGIGDAETFHRFFDI